MPASLYSVTVPAGTIVNLRLTTEVSSDKPSGQPANTVVIAPVLLNNTVAIAPGTQFEGVTADAHADQPAADGKAEQPATLRLQFTKIKGKSGQSKNVSCAVAGIDNARESIDQSGLITGILASRSFGSLADSGINKLLEKNSGLGQLLSDVKKAAVKETDPSIDYKPGVELTVKLTQPLDWTPSGDWKMPGPVQPADQLQAYVAQQPFRTPALSPPNPSDLTNLMFIGSKEQVEQHFKDAGWFASDPLGQESKFRTAQAIIENRGYDEAPMSVLTLAGKPADMTFEKQNNTFAARHHIRIWQLPQPFNNRTVFVAAATHDTKIYFSKTSRSITHGIDPNIDREREKVVNDMLFAGHVQAVSLVDRTNIPKNISNASGDVLQTDDKIAVVEFGNK